jgi:hypothetical protein
VSEVIARDAGKYAAAQAVIEAIDLPVLGKQHPVGRAQEIEMLEVFLRLDVMHAGDMQAAKDVEGNNPHKRPTTELIEKLY